MPTPPLDPLAELRAEIDRIDLDMHRLLMRRGEIIDRLIAVKRAQGGGCAFRPDREAKMMRALVERHRGLLPVDAVESVWRVIISTFTYVQSPYAVHADESGASAEMRDCARFHFGFTVPFVAHPDAAAVVAAVAASKGDLGLLRADGPGAWWEALTAPDAPKIIARLPFVERPDHPAGLPVFVAAQPLVDAAAPEIVLYAVAAPRWSQAVADAAATLGCEIFRQAVSGAGRALLVAAPGGLAADDLAHALERAGAGAARAALVGSCAARYRMAEAQEGVLAS